MPIPAGCPVGGEPAHYLRHTLPIKPVTPKLPITCLAVGSPEGRHVLRVDKASHYHDLPHNLWVSQWLVGLMHGSCKWIGFPCGPFQLRHAART
jgi:hypothetical protein